MGISILMKLYKIIFEEKEKIVFAMDMDGVLADFDQGVANNSYYIEVIGKFEKALDTAINAGLIPESILSLPTAVAKMDEVKKYFAGEQTNPIMKSLKKIANEAKGTSISIATKPGFFLNLEELPGAQEMMRKAKELTGQLPIVITAPVKSATCEKEKHEWMNNHFSGMFSEFHCDDNKAQFAKPNICLIDDRSKNTIPFEAAGGQVILHTDASSTISKMEKIVDEWNQNKIE